MTSPDPARRRALRLPQPRRVRAGSAQLLFAAVGAVAGIAASHIATGPMMPANRAVDLLITFGFGVLGVASVIYSLLFLVTQWAAGNLSPRLTLFRDDPIVWRTFAYIVGVFVFCVVTVLSLGARETTSVIIPLIALLLALVAMVLIRNLQLKAFASIQLAPTLAAVTDRGEKILRTLHDAPDRAAPTELPPQQSTVTWPGRVRVLQQIDLTTLISTATNADAVIVFRQQIGATLRTGSLIADVHGHPLPPQALLAALSVGNQRTFGQDPLFALRLLADIALRALSPAVNDPGTVVQTLDHIHQLLANVTGHHQHSGALADANGAVRVVLALPTWADYVGTGLADIIAAAGRSPMVRDRLTDLITELATLAEPVDRPLLLAWLAELNPPHKM